MTDFVSFSKRPEWADVKPIPQDDGDHPVVSIAYSEEFVETMDYFRAIIATNEKSDRALQLTEEVIALNPANYTVWQFRRELLEALGKSWEDELKYVTLLIQDNQKNYQVWYHRRVVVEKSGLVNQEKPFTASILEDDSKNYHAWAHRQWVIRTYSLWDEELEYIDALLNDDVMNNSAWNQRFFVISNQEISQDVCDREVKYTLDKIKTRVDNESPWNYLRGLLKATLYSFSFPESIAFAEKLVLQQPKSTFPLAFLADMLEVRRQSGDRARILEFIDKLLTLDPIRANYWKHRHLAFSQESW
eukprot:TRINITY_DN8709_c0_g1::TRINITY_DN8709_c0_g1_i1::g.349::m.349 TRINITY_DN8709_c0_g1::TRINITY_DN8709_c0_g1_i1::g.349  ORF type:complete len:318 (+),score=71.99,sp/P93227/FNTA_SOLLC/45.51/2e-85,PPTA/PF01239.17/3.9e-09,PPTA/PF01239.17/1.8e-10,PPTA/PF01239.17/7.9e-09,PPTA/PF01239.17/1.6e-07,PPTA/PF01239.17/3.8e-05,PPTA/PF01239.17/44,TPR_14/PF13428.1/9.3,TPR_14/PF13428.1/1.5e+04,TPR_14/PF13428.1/8.1,DUF3524/PF12038.3/3.9e+03,DUF3524/PF12038.3/0.025,TPR_11/PF13414.1/1.2,TPR_11/PF13414.1/1.4e+02 TRINITY_D